MDAYLNGFAKKRNTYRVRYHASSGNIIPASRIAAQPVERTASAGTRVSPLSGAPAIHSRIEALIERILCLLDMIIDALSSSKALTVVRTSVSVVCLLTIIGIIGGIESGAVSWSTGIIVSLIAAVIETVCIRKCR